MEATPERKPPNRGIEVKLLGHSPDPIRSLYLAYRTAYSALTPLQIDDRIEDERITRETMLEFIEERLKTGHASPLEQVVFEFGISGVSRAFSHQFVRHRIGISFEQQTQRYVTFKGGEFPYMVPEIGEARRPGRRVRPAGVRPRGRALRPPRAGRHPRGGRALRPAQRHATPTSRSW